MSKTITRDEAQKLKDMLLKVGMNVPQEVETVLADPEPVEEIMCDCGLPCHPNTPCSEMIQYYNHVDSTYLDLLRLILKKGRLKKNRTGIDTIGVFGAQAKFDVNMDAFPILTTKKIFFKAIVHELLWFIRGDTNIKYLVDNDVHIWDEWAYAKYKKAQAWGLDDAHHHGNATMSLLTQDEFIERIKNDSKFAKKWGDLGEGTYGGMWRGFPVTHYYNQAQVTKLSKVGDTIHSRDGERYEVFVDQLRKVMDKLQKNPDDRRMIVSAWHPYWVDHCALPPCHCMFHFNTEELTVDERYEYANVRYKLEETPEFFEVKTDEDITKWLDNLGVPKRKLNLLLYQRSCDTFLGVPFNITSYCLLLAMVAHCSNMVPGEFTHTYGDLHIYVNHKEQVKTQLARTPKLLPKLWLNPSVRDLFAFTYSDIKLENYNPHPTIKAEVAV